MINYFFFMGKWLEIDNIILFLFMYKIVCYYDIFYKVEIIFLKKKFNIKL